MSDCDDFMGDDEEYDLEYSEESNSEPDVDLENQYYNSKALKEDDPKAALESFQRWVNPIIISLRFQMTTRLISILSVPLGSQGFRFRGRKGRMGV